MIITTDTSVAQLSLTLNVQLNMNFKQNMFDVMKYECFIGHFLPKIIISYIYFLFNYPSLFVKRVWNT